MNKFIVMLSGGKDSLACYLKLVEDYGSSNVLPISLSYFYNGNKDRDSTVNAHLTRLTASMNVTIVNGNEKDFSDILDGLFVDIDPTEYYLCTGEIDHFGEVALYYEIINKYKLRGLYNPFIGKPKSAIFRVLEKYDVEFAMLSAFVNANNIPLKNRVLEFIGQRYTVSQLETLYNTDREAYFALQTVTLQCSGYSTFNEDEIQNVLDTIQQNKSIEKSIYQM